MTLLNSNYQKLKKENGTFKLHKSISSTRKSSLAINLFNSNNLEEITNRLVLSLDDYMELLFTYIQNVNTNSDLAAKFIRLLTITKKIYGVQLGDDWAESIREKLKSISNPNGLLFTAVLIYNTKQDNKSADHKSADGDDTLDWFDLVNTDTWLESMEQQYLTTVRDSRSVRSIIIQILTARLSPWIPNHSTFSNLSKYG